MFLSTIEELAVSETVSGNPSMLRACFGFAAILLIAAVGVMSYKHIAEEQMLLECNGDKKLLRKKKRGSIYVNLLDSDSTSVS